MMKTLISTTLLALTLFSQGGSAAESALAASLTSAHGAVAAAEIIPAATAQPAHFRLGVIGDARNGRPGNGRPGNVRPGNLRPADRPSEVPAADGLPSTPVALAALLLMICILVGRRGTTREEV